VPTLSDKSIPPIAIRIFLASLLFFFTLEASDPINNGLIVYAQQLQEINNNRVFPMRATSSAGTFEIVLDIESFPIESQKQTMLNLTFIRLAEPAVIQLNVGYDVFILDEDDNIIFRASNQSGQEQEEEKKGDVLYSADGIALVPSQFESAGNYTVHVRILQVNFVPIHPEFVAFPITVVP
jgi:hypothetical protein